MDYIVSYGQPPVTPVEGSILTQRQRAIFNLIVVGQSNKEIARKLGLSPSTVKIHVECCSASSACIIAALSLLPVGSSGFGHWLKADISRVRRDVRFMPNADIGVVSSLNEKPRRHAGVSYLRH